MYRICSNRARCVCGANDAHGPLRVAQMTSTACVLYNSWLRALFKNLAREVLDNYLISLLIKLSELKTVLPEPEQLFRGIFWITLDRGNFFQKFFWNLKIHQRSYKPCKFRWNT